MKASIFFFVILSAHAAIAMDKDSGTIKSKNLEFMNNTSILRGIVAGNPKGAHLECTIFYNRETGDYQGTLYNHGDHIAILYSRDLGPEEAQKYCQQLLKDAAAKTVNNKV